MIEQGFNYADSTIKEMTDCFESKVENKSCKVLQAMVNKHKQKKKKISGATERATKN